MRYRVGARTDVGRVREGNEDAYAVLDSLFAVADGMGGHQGGEVASRIALETLERMSPSGDGEPHLADVVKHANRNVLEAASKDPRLAGMGTTLTAALALDDGIHVAHVGDSRAYLLRDGDLRQLTIDHTVVQRLVDEGRITRNEADIHPQRSILTRALGVDQEVTVDEAVVDVEPGDRLLLCSDGLTGMVDEDEIRRLLAENEDPQAASDALVDAANQAGGQDNITAVVIDVLEGTGSEVAPSATARRPRGRPRDWEPAQRRWPRRVVLWVVLPLVVVAAALAVGWRWVQSQWFVGVSNGKVAIFRGIPAEPLGIELFGVESETRGLEAAEVEGFPEYAGVDEGITAESEEDAKAIIEDMRQTVKDAAQEERGVVGGGGGG